MMLEGGVKGASDVLVYGLDEVLRLGRGVLWSYLCSPALCTLPCHRSPSGRWVEASRLD